MNDPIAKAIERAIADLDQDAFDLHTKYVALMFDIMQRHIDALTRERDLYKFQWELSRRVERMGRMQ